MTFPDSPGPWIPHETGIQEVPALQAARIVPTGSGPTVVKLWGGVAGQNDWNGPNGIGEWYTYNENATNTLAAEKVARSSGSATMSRIACDMKPSFPGVPFPAGIPVAQPENSLGWQLRYGSNQSPVWYSSYYCQLAGLTDEYNAWRDSTDTAWGLRAFNAWLGTNYIPETSHHYRLITRTVYDVPPGLVVTIGPPSDWVYSPAYSLPSGSARDLVTPVHYSNTSPGWTLTAADLGAPDTENVSSNKTDVATVPNYGTVIMPAMNVPSYPPPGGDWVLIAQLFIISRAPFSEYRILYAGAETVHPFLVGGSDKRLTRFLPI